LHLHLLQFAILQRAQLLLACILHLLHFAIQQRVQLQLACKILVIFNFKHRVFKIKKRGALRPQLCCFQSTS
jgi:hypothetical protein